MFWISILHLYRIRILRYVHSKNILAQIHAGPTYWAGSMTLLRSKNKFSHYTLKWTLRNKYPTTVLPATSSNMVAIFFTIVSHWYWITVMSWWFQASIDHHLTTRVFHLFWVKMRFFFYSLCCVTTSLNTFTLLSSVRFQNVFCSNLRLNCKWFSNIKCCFHKLMDIVHFSTRIYLVQWAHTYYHITKAYKWDDNILH